MALPGLVRRINELGQITIPKEFRRALGIEEGDPIEICIDVKRKKLVLKKYPENEDND